MQQKGTKVYKFITKLINNSPKSKMEFQKTTGHYRNILTIGDLFITFDKKDNVVDGI